jgi:hypothetical protein
MGRVIPGIEFMEKLLYSNHVRGDVVPEFDIYLGFNWVFWVCAGKGKLNIKTKPNEEVEV